MERCPLCKARLKDVTGCPRCGADLTVLLSLEVQAESLQKQVIALLAKREMTNAWSKVERLLSLKSTPLVRVLRGFIQHLEQAKEVPNQQVNHSEKMPKIPKVIILGYQPN